MTVVERKTFPKPIEDIVYRFIDVLVESGFYDDPNEFQPTYVDLAIDYTWNMVGDAYLSRFLAGEDYSMLPEKEAEKVLNMILLQTNLTSLMDSGMINGVENEHGEMVYWATDKGKQYNSDELSNP